MPETDESATDFVLGGDTRLVELREALARAEARHEPDPDDADLGMEIAQPALRPGRRRRARRRAARPGADPGPGLQDARAGRARQQLLGRLAHAAAAGARADVPVATCCCSTSRPTTWTWTRWSGWKPGCKRYAGTMIVISHDREFLDAVTDVTLHIERQQLTRYGGNYSAFETLRAQQLELQQSAFSKQQDKIAHLQKFIDRFKAKASKAKQAQSRVKALERMEKIAPVLADADFTFEFKEPAQPARIRCWRSAMAQLRLRDRGRASPRSSCAASTARCWPASASASWAPTARASRRWSRPSRATWRALAGTITEGKGLNIGYFAQQELDVLRPQDTPLEHMVRLARELGPNSGESQPRAGPAQLPGQLQLQRRHGQAGRRHHERRREGAAGAGDDGLAAPQPAAAGRADQPPGPGHARGACRWRSTSSKAR